MEPTPLPTICIVVLNWNAWGDTIECLESLFRLDYPDFRVVVCDNDSADGSVERIEEWAAGRLAASSGSGDPRIRALVEPPVPKPIAVQVLDAPREWRIAPPAVPLTILRTGGNLGYAGGNNAGLRLGQAWNVGGSWVLNNDTVVDRQALRALVSRMQQDPDTGICGSTLLFYDRPELVQAAAGATYNRFTAIPTHIGEYRPRADVDAAPRVEALMSYVVGASMLVSADFVRETGLMDEDYFLYYEEIDWVRRAPSRFRLGYAPDSLVYHKVGATAGSSNDWRTRSEISDLCAIRNRLLITWRFYRPWYPFVLATMAGVALLRIRRRQYRRAAQVVRIMMAPGSFHPAKYARESRRSGS